MANPTDHLTTVQAALDLAGKATPGPWTARGCSFQHGIVQRSGNGAAHGFQDDAPCSFDDGEANAAAIVALRNAAPAIAALADECERLADLFDRIDTAFDQLRPAMADPFVAFVCATMHAAKDPAAPAPALLSDVPMGGDA